MDFFCCRPYCNYSLDPGQGVIPDPGTSHVKYILDTFIAQIVHTSFSWSPAITGERLLLNLGSECDGISSTGS